MNGMHRLLSKPHSNAKKIFLAVGGTGGHIFPAIALAKQLVGAVFIGVNLETNPFFPKEECPYFNLAGKSFFALLKGIVKSIRILKREQPDLVVGFGSVYAFPVLVAALILKIPFVLFEANAIPGRVTKMFSKKALFSAVQFTGCSALLKGKVKEVEPLIRQQAHVSRSEACAFYGFDEDAFILLIFGGSQGAVTLNQKIIETLASCSLSHVQILHIIGNRTSKEEMEKAYATQKIFALVKHFEENMEYAWKVANLAICRSGAGAIAEHILFEVPCIFIPFPHAKDDHQTINALFAANAIKGSVLLPEVKLNPHTFKEIFEILLKNDQKKLKEMVQSIKTYKNLMKKEKLSELICNTILSE